MQGQDQSANLRRQGHAGEGVQEILMVENVNTYELPSEWIWPSSCCILSGFGSVTGHRNGDC